MKLPEREFPATPAVRTQVPLWIGLMGPSGGGKTYSALEIATGLQAVRGGDIYFIDTEANRALHYADYFKFFHVPFRAPFGALDYLAAIKSVVARGAGVVIVDSMSHEHEGEGGLIESHEAEVERMAGNDFKKREAVKMLAWNKPKQARRQLIQAMLQMNTCFVLCFRSKDSSKPIRKDGKMEVVHMGFVPIAGDEFVFEMTVNALLLPGAAGVPTWNSELAGEQMRVKKPRQFLDVFKDGQPLTRDHGRVLAEWAQGSVPAVPQHKDKPIQAYTPVPERLTLAVAAMRSATSVEAVEALWKKASKLRLELDNSALDALTLTYESRLTDLSEVTAAQ